MLKTWTASLTRHGKSQSSVELNIRRIPWTSSCSMWPDLEDRKRTRATDLPHPPLPASAALAYPVFYRSYSRQLPSGERESPSETIERAVNDMSHIGNLTAVEKALISENATKLRALPSGRALWVAGTGWSKFLENASGYYNCTSTIMNNIRCFGDLMNLSMMGCGTGAVLEESTVRALPPIVRAVEVRTTPLGHEGGVECTTIKAASRPSQERQRKEFQLTVGDSRKGWVDAYQAIINVACGTPPRKAMLPSCSHIGTDQDPIVLHVDLSQVRPAGSLIKGFGGTANPVALPRMFSRVGFIVNRILSTRPNGKMTPLDACMLIDEAASAVVAGNVRRSAGMRQFSLGDADASNAKENLYTMDSNGNWTVDKEREALRMSNHTRVCHSRPTFEEIRASVRKQYETGEGALQYAPEAVARANADLFDGTTGSRTKQSFLEAYEKGGPSGADCWLREVGRVTDARERRHRLSRYGLNPCGEIIGADFHCNLSEVHLNQLNPFDHKGQQSAFYAAGLNAAALLQQSLPQDRYQYSRVCDPIVGVSFTGLFDFLVSAHGIQWIEWVSNGRPLAKEVEHFKESEIHYLQAWKAAARQGVEDYCASRSIPVPNRITTVQPAGTKSLLTGASPGWHPPKAARVIRRVTFQARDPVALACIDFGYTAIPSSSARDSKGRLLQDINDPRATEWLIEIPTEVPWAAELDLNPAIDLANIGIQAQWDMYMTVQKHYTEHNTSATLEFRKDEIDTLSKLIHDGMGQGYISAALLARCDARETFPRLPFQPIDKDTYQELMWQVLKRRKSNDFSKLLQRRDEEVNGAHSNSTGDNACDGGACLRLDTTSCH